MKLLEQKEQPRIIKTFEGFWGKKNKYDDLENLSKPNQSGEVDAATRNKILNVDNFNNWLTNEWTGYGGGKGAPGLIGRIDKLSPSMVEDYFLDQGVQCEDNEIFDFINEITKTWRANR